jgi:D-glycero-D-manno-heptose 1,7-bisphosphate phosphatase
MANQKALFLDRDGVINTDHGYVCSREDFHFQQGIFELCRAAQTLGYLLLVVTNQAGIARGYFTESDFERLTKWMVDTFSERQVHIARVYHCAYHPIHGIGQYKYDSPDRKPNPGMLLRAREDFRLDLGASILIGDKLSDIEAAKAAGVGTAILLRSNGAGLEVEKDYAHVSGSLDEIRAAFFSPAH